MKKSIITLVIFFVLQVVLTGIITQNRQTLDDIEREIETITKENISKEKTIAEVSSCEKILEAKERLTARAFLDNKGEIAYKR